MKVLGLHSIMVLMLLQVSYLFMYMVPAILTCCAVKQNLPLLSCRSVAAIYFFVFFAPQMQRMFVLTVYMPTG